MQQGSNCLGHGRALVSEVRKRCESLPAEVGNAASACGVVDPACVADLGGPRQVGTPILHAFTIGVRIPAADAALCQLLNAISEPF